MNSTIAFIAEPVDSRCQWWAVRIPAGYAEGLDLSDTSSLRPLGFLWKGADLELEEGEAVLTSEAKHHRKARGFAVVLRVVVGGTLHKYTPGAEQKAAIKAAATPEQWSELKNGSGDVAACLRVLKFLGMANEEQLRQVFPKTADAKYGALPSTEDVAA